LEKKDNIYRIKIGILETNPIVWRRFLIPSKITLHHLHLVLQEVMGWKNYHLYRFEIGKNQYGEPNPDNDIYGLPFINTRQTKLNAVIENKGSLFLYEYDFGDGWEHQLVVEDILEFEPDTQYPVCIGGENACPPEDCGGPHGYAQMLEIIRNPAQEEYRSTKTWLGRRFNPSKFGLTSTNLRLRSMRLK
jgi:Plasmid pRiA4b ORF-3-like protein